MTFEESNLQKAYIYILKILWVFRVLLDMNLAVLLQANVATLWNDTFTERTTFSGMASDEGSSDFWKFMTVNLVSVFMTENLVSV